MQEIIPIRVIYHGEFKQERRINVRFKKEDFPSLESLKKYIKNVILNNHSKFMIVKKIDVYIPVNGDEIGRILKMKAKKVEVVDDIIVNVH